MDLAIMKLNFDAYTGRFGSTIVSTPTCEVRRQWMEIETCIQHDPDENPFAEPKPLTRWVPTRAILVPDHVKRLSGAEIYNAVYFGLSPRDTSQLAVGYTKNALQVRLA